MTKIEKLYSEYLFFVENVNAKRVLLSTVEICDKQLYYKLQAKIFVEMQKPLYKHVAQELVDDCMKYTGRFKIQTAEAQIHERIMFMDSVPDDVKTANLNRLKILNFSI